MKYLLIILLFLAGCNNETKVTGLVKDSLGYYHIPTPDPTYINGHRLHRLGMIYDTYPPFYSCVFCFGEFSPYQYPHDESKGSRYDWYGIFCDSLKQIGQSDDSVFMDKWNELDTSCISREIAMNKSQDIWNNWKASHGRGTYYLDSTSSMHTDGWLNYYDSAGSFTMGHGGRYNDSIILADKWYKIILDSLKNQE